MQQVIFDFGAQSFVQEGAPLLVYNAKAVAESLIIIGSFRGRVRFDYREADWRDSKK
jgi:hypothetical protein